MYRYNFTYANITTSLRLTLTFFDKVITIHCKYKYYLCINKNLQLCELKQFLKINN